MGGGPTWYHQGVQAHGRIEPVAGKLRAFDLVASPPSSRDEFLVDSTRTPAVTAAAADLTRDEFSEPDEFNSRVPISDIVTLRV